LERFVAACQFHPDRAAVGLCMRCRRTICADCCTRLQGVNHCHACLKELGGSSAGGDLSRASRSHTPVESWPVVAVCLSGLGWLVLLFVCWLLRGAVAP
jgi:hypothetical protein